MLRRDRERIALALVCGVIVAVGVLVGANLYNQPHLGGKTVTIGIDPQDVAIVDGIGCCGRAVALETGGIDQHDRPMLTGDLNVLDARTGMTARRIPVGRGPFEMVVNARTGHAFVLDQGAPTSPAMTVHAVDTGSGRQLWARPLFALPGAGRAWRTAGNVLNATPTWSALDGRGAMAMDESIARLFVVNRIIAPRTRATPTMYLLDTSGGTLVRTIHLSTPAVDIAVDPRAHHAFATSVSSSAVWMLDSRTGDLLRTLWAASVPVAIVVSQARGEVVVAGPATTGVGGIVQVFGANTGRLLRTIPTSTYPSQIVLDTREDRAFVLNEATGGARAGGSVTIVDLKAGHVLRTIVVGSNPSALVVDGQAGRIVVVDQGRSLDNGTVSTLDASSGRLLRSVTVGFRPHAIALDRQSDQILTISQLAVAPPRGAVASVIERLRELGGSSNERGVLTILGERDLG